MIKKAIKKWLGIDILETEAYWTNKNRDDMIDALKAITKTLKSLTDIVTEMNK